MSLNKYEYAFKTWGGFYNEEFKKLHGREQGTFYFDTRDERDAEVFVLESLKTLYCPNAMNLVIQKFEGDFARYSTVAKLKFGYNNAVYYLDFDFGPAYPFSGAIFMFTEGNYSCDCNRSLFLKKKYPEAFPNELPCGNKIELLRISVVYEKKEYWK